MTEFSDSALTPPSLSELVPRADVDVAPVEPEGGVPGIREDAEVEVGRDVPVRVVIQEILHARRDQGLAELIRELEVEDPLLPERLVVRDIRAVDRAVRPEHAGAGGGSEVAAAPVAGHADVVLWLTG